MIKIDELSKITSRINPISSLLMNPKPKSGDFFINIRPWSSVDRGYGFGICYYYSKTNLLRNSDPTIPSTGVGILFFLIMKSPSMCL